jgi:hypothetical protein
MPRSDAADPAVSVVRWRVRAMTRGSRSWIIAGFGSAAIDGRPITPAPGIAAAVEGRAKKAD